MKNLIKLTVILTFTVFIQQSAICADSDLETLRKKVKEIVLQPAVNESRVKDLMASIKEDGSWPDINYIDVSITGFQNSEHLRNLTELGRAYKKSGSGLKDNRKLKAVIYSALDFWLKNDFICDNWWYNQMGVPGTLTTLLFIMDEDLTKEQIAKTLAITGRANLQASGARVSGDRIRIAEILAQNALFKRDGILFNDVNKVIEGEIKFTTGRGMQYDYSFHHRDDRVTSTLSYGLQYADVFAEWAALVAGTKYSFSAPSINQLIDYYLDGICQTMVFGKYPDPGAKNRAITGSGALRPSGPATPERLLTVSSYRKNELENIIKIRKGEKKPDMTGERFYWDSEYFSHQRPGWFASVRMYSSRNHSMEVPYDGEGLMNHHFADGSNFISRTGRDYTGIFPVFDWQKIPGTTVVQKPALPSENEIQKKGLTDFVGAVTDGEYGAAVFDFKSPLDPLSARKAWFFFDDEYVCLGTGINSGANLPVATTLNQCLLKGAVTVMSENEKAVLQPGERELKNVKWIWHDSIAYLFPEPATVNLSNQPATGSWYRINRQSRSSKKEISLNVFKLWIDHGRRPARAAYRYIIVPAVALTDMDDLKNDRNIEVLSNTTEIQAVKHSRLNIYQVVFYKAGKIQITPDIQIGMDSPGLLMVKTDGGKITSLSVSDPSRNLARIHFTISSRLEKREDNFRSVWDESRKASDISVDLPLAEYAGKSVIIKLN